MTRARTLLSLGLTAVASMAALRGPAAADEPPSLGKRVASYLHPYVETGNFSGSVLIARQGRILVSRGFGLADIEEGTPNAPGTVFHLASVSRIFTSAAILLLEQQGKLSVDDPLSKHLPGWPRGDEITIHHLLTLSAGFPNINELPGYVLWSASHQTPASLAQRFRDLPLEFPPGTRTVHSNSNYNVLALLIEKVSGKSFGAFLHEELFAPLAMTRTGHDDDSRKIPHAAIGYRPSGRTDLRQAEDLHWSVKTGNGSLYSTTGDLYRFDRMLARASLLNEASIGKLFAEHFPRNGYGWFLGERSGSREIYINGRSPGFGAYWGRAVEPDVTVIVLGNLYSSATTPIGRDLMALALGREVASPTLRPEPPDPALLAELVGTYRFGPDFYRPNGTAELRIRDGHLFYGDDWMIPVGGMTFIHRVYWSTLEFRRDGSGRVTSLRFDDFVGVRK